MNESRTIYVLSPIGESQAARRQWLYEAGYQVQQLESINQVDAIAADGTPCCILIEAAPDAHDLIEMIRHLTREAEFTVVVLHTEPDIRLAVAAMRAGASDVLCTAAEEQTLAQHIHHAMNMDVERAGRRKARHEIHQRIDSLTPREREVMGLVVGGKANKAIASEMGVSIKTVEVHRSRVMQKMRAPSLANLVEQALVSGFREGVC